MTKTNSKKFKMSAGLYYVGDLCYVLDEAHEGSDATWDELHDMIFTDEHPNGIHGKFTLSDGRELVELPTKYGDGSYRADGATTGECSVDSGSIGCIKVSDIKNFNEAEAKRLGLIVEFEHDFYCVDDNGVLNFGDVVINTDDDYDYDDEWRDDVDNDDDSQY